MSSESVGTVAAFKKERFQNDSYLPTQEIMDLWNQVHGELRNEFGEAVFRSWLKPLTLQAAYHGTLEVSVPTRFMRDWIQSHYAAKILEMCTQRNPDIRRLEIVVVQSAMMADQSQEEAQKPKANQNVNVVAQELQELSSPFDPRFTFDTFVIGKPNALAHAAASRIIESANVPFNPLFIYGGVGLGKTHLMHAIGAAMRQKYPEKRVIYLSAEKFMYQFVKSLRAKDMMSFKEAFRSVDVLMMDDIQFISGKEQTQEEFFHTFNALVDQNKQIVISADKAPSDLLGLEERLRSRLAWGLVADIQPSTYDLRLGILESKRTLLNANIPDAVLEFLALKVTSNIRELEGALNRIVAHADVTKQLITLESTQDVLQDLLRAHDRRITIDEIQRKVAEHYNIRLQDMHSARRARNVARPRQVAMYLAKQLTARSLPEIGRKFGGRDHTTVMHAVRKVEELMVEDTQIAQDVEIIRRALTG
ncbi:MAG: chromosomal replication initiator protein DnaA [Micavibrio aeruginosavorus]|uniref:Chromosomal replication initiator protein DnaA n=1 Tax=Micavibrio aeruginosavorus TaxID=349221 RepID=A0A7T5UH80_9BACT|nr:MAG: chromosomal replication initiator protein DnaA [Micavibrio aeruginosavorus]